MTYRILVALAVPAPHPAILKQTLRQSVQLKTTETTEVRYKLSLRWM